MNRRTETTEEGLVVDLDTGEVVGAAVPLEVACSGVMDDGLAAWVLKKYGRLHAGLKIAVDAAIVAQEALDRMEREALAALKSNPDYVQALAVVANCERIETRTRKGLDWLDGAYLKDLANFAASKLTGDGRTWATPWGSVALKRQPAKLEVADEAQVLKYARRVFPSALKVTETFQVSKLPNAVKRNLLENPKAAEDVGFRVVEAFDKPTIQTGVSA